MSEQHEEQHNEQPPVTPSSDGTENTGERSAFIPRKRFDEVLGTAKDAQRELEQARQKLAALEKAEQERQQAKLEEEGNYKAIIDSLKPEVERAKELEAQLALYKERDKAELEAELDALDDTMRGLVPEIDPAAQLKWVRDARRAGLFDKAKPPVTDAGATGDRKTPDVNLTPEQERLKSLAKSYGYLRRRG